MSLEIRTDRTLVRSAARSTRYLHARVVAPEGEKSIERAPVEVAFVIDRSGSMGGGKLDLAKEALAQALAMLSAKDWFALVVYDDRIDVLADLGAATAEAKRVALARLSEVEARGTTNLSGGWATGADPFMTLPEGTSLRRVLLLTDGLANVGLTAPSELESLATEARLRGIATSTFGIGDDFDENLLQRMAHAGGGNFWYIERPEQIPELLTSELGEVLEIVARDVELVVEGAPGLEVEPLTPVRSTAGPTADSAVPKVWHFGLGDLVSSQELDILIRVTFPTGVNGEAIVLAARLTDRDGVLDATPREAWWEYADHATNDAQPREREIDRMVALMYAARVRREALLLNRDGQCDKARTLLLAVARRIAGYAGEDRELGELVAALRREAEELAYRLADSDRKGRFFDNQNVLSVRQPSGLARRSRPREPGRPGGR